MEKNYFASKKILYVALCLFCLVTYLHLAYASFNKISIGGWILLFIFMPMMFNKANNQSHLKTVQFDWKVDFFIVIIFNIQGHLLSLHLQNNISISDYFIIAIIIIIMALFFYTFNKFKKLSVS